MRARSGFEPSPFDGRNWAWQATGVPESRLTAPFAARDQWEVPCCVSMAIVGAMEMLDARLGGVQALSPLFHYYFTRRSASYLGDASIHAGLQTAVDVGVCPHADHGPPGSRPWGPYLREDALQPPSAVAALHAEDYRLLHTDPDLGTLGYYQFDHAPEWAWREALAEGTPIIAGFWATESYWALAEGQTALWDVSHDQRASGHAVLVHAVEGDWFIVRDSRGPAFGQDGDWRVHRELVNTRWLVESWAMRRIAYDT